MGSRKCWVCLGTGEIESEYGRITPCHRCAGSGICPVCAD